MPIQNQYIMRANNISRGGGIGRPTGNQMVTLSSITYSIKSLFSIAYRYERD